MNRRNHSSNQGYWLSAKFYHAKINADYTTHAVVNFEAEYTLRVLPLKKICSEDWIDPRCSLVQRYHRCNRYTLPLTKMDDLH